MHSFAIHSLGLGHFSLMNVQASWLPVISALLTSLTFFPVVDTHRAPNVILGSQGHVYWHFIHSTVIIHLPLYVPQQNGHHLGSGTGLPHALRCKE